MQIAPWAQVLNSQDSAHCKRIPKVSVVASGREAESPAPHSRRLVAANRIRLPLLGRMTDELYPWTNAAVRITQKTPLFPS